MPEDTEYPEVEILRVECHVCKVKWDLDYEPPKCEEDHEWQLSIIIPGEEDNAVADSEVGGEVPGSEEIEREGSGDPRLPGIGD